MNSDTFFVGASVTAVASVLVAVGSVIMFDTRPQSARKPAVNTSAYFFVHEATLSDGTRCAVVNTDRAAGGVGITCNWKK